MLADDELKTSLAEAVKAGKVAEWASAQGVEATEEELLAYAKPAAAEDNELKDEDLEKVASGGYGTGIFVRLLPWVLPHGRLAVATGRVRGTTCEGVCQRGRALRPAWWQSVRPL